RCGCNRRKTPRKPSPAERDSPCRRRKRDGHHEEPSAIRVVRDCEGNEHRENWRSRREKQREWTESTSSHLSRDQEWSAQHETEPQRPVVGERSARRPSVAVGVERCEVGLAEGEPNALVAANESSLRAGDDKGDAGDTYDSDSEEPCRPLPSS